MSSSFSEVKTWKGQRVRSTHHLTMDGECNSEQTSEIVDVELSPKAGRNYSGPPIVVQSIEDGKSVTRIKWISWKSRI